VVLTEEQKAVVAKEHFFSSKVETFLTPRNATKLTFKQSPAWDNWQKIPSVKPQGAEKAPIFLPVKNGD